MASDPESLSPDQTVPLKRWGTDIEPEAANQMAAACHLPIALQAALMPDAHVGYGLPIGGVLATRDAVIPYAVGVDIACRMRLTIFNEKPDLIPGQRDRLKTSSLIRLASVSEPNLNSPKITPSWTKTGAFRPLLRL